MYSVIEKGREMRKTITTILMLCLVFGLIAQQNQKLKKTSGKNKKMDWEAEYYKMEKQKDSAHNAYQALMKEHEKLRKEKKALETKNQNLNKIKAQNKTLKEENARLKAELESYNKKSNNKKLKKTKQN